MVQPARGQCMFERPHDVLLPDQMLESAGSPGTCQGLIIHIVIALDPLVMESAAGTVWCTAYPDGLHYRGICYAFQAAGITTPAGWRPAPVTHGRPSHTLQLSTSGHGGV